MNILFIHQNFPSQYRNFARHCAADAANRVAAPGNAANLRERTPLPGVGENGGACAGLRKKSCGMMENDRCVERLGRLLRLDRDESAGEKPLRVPRRSRLFSRRVRNWALAAGLACLGSFVQASAADSVGVWGGGGGGGGAGSSNGGGGGGAGQVVWGGVGYSGNGGSPGGGQGAAILPPPGTPSITVGDGGAGGEADFEGNDGGASSLTFAGMIPVGQIDVYGGGAGGSGDDNDDFNNGGGGGGGYYAGGDGGANWVVSNRGGAGGGLSGDSSTEDYSKSGGAGGSATLTLDEVQLSGDITVVSGESAATVEGNAGAKGGAATFLVDKLTATDDSTQNFVFNKQGGDLDVNIGTLEISQSDVSITLTGTAAADVTLGNLIFGAGTDLTVAASTGAMTAAGDITVDGRGATMNLGNVAAYNATNKNLHFILPPDYAPGEVLLAVTNSNINVTGANVSVELNVNATNLKKGDNITLIDSDVIIIGDTATTGSTITTTGLGTKRLTLQVLQDDPTRLYANVLRIGGTDVGTTLVEGSAAVRADILYQRASTMAGYIHTLSTKPYCTPAGWTTFASAGGFDDNLDTGHDLDLRGFTFAVGGVKYWNLGAGRVFAGLAAEGGRGNYTTRVSTDGDRYRGDGHADYAGGSFFARLELPAMINLDASFSLGSVGSDFRSAEYNGRKAFDSRTAYFAAHVGLDKTFAVNPLNSVTVFSRLQYTRQNSDSFTTIADEKVRLDAFNSTYSSLGARYERSITPRVKAYAGAAWEYEFGGKAKASLDGERLDNLSRLRGHSGIGELGIAMRACDCGGFEADISLRGRVGKRRGVAAGVTLGYSF